MKYLKTISQFSKIFEKNELRYSETAYSKICEILKNLRDKKRWWNYFTNLDTLVFEIDSESYFDKNFGRQIIEINVPLEEVVYNEFNKNCYIVVKYLLNNEIDVEKTIQILSEVVQKRTFSKSNFIINSDKFKFFKLKISFENKFSGSSGSYSKKNDILKINLSGLGDFLTNEKTYFETIRHELQHLTQDINDSCISVRENLFFLFDEFEILRAEKIALFRRKYKDVKIEIDTDISNKSDTEKLKILLELCLTQKTVFGLGKEKLGKSSSGQYYTSDEEYHTHMSDTLNYFIDTNLELIQKNTIEESTKLIFDKIKKYWKFQLVSNVRKSAPGDYFINLENKIKKIKKII